MYIPEPRKNKDGTWSIQLRINKQSIMVNADSAKECKRRAAIVKAEAQNAAKPIKKSELTLTQAIDEYINTRQNSLLHWRGPAHRRGNRKPRAGDGEGKGGIQKISGAESFSRGGGIFADYSQHREGGKRGRKTLTPQYPHREAVLFEPVYCGGMDRDCQKLFCKSTE